MLVVLLMFLRMVMTSGKIVVRATAYKLLICAIQQKILILSASKMVLVTNIDIQLLRRFSGVSILLLLISCGSFDDKEVSSLLYLPQVCIDIPATQLPYYRIFSVYEEADAFYLLGHNTSTSSLDLFSITDRSFISTFALDGEGPLGIQNVVGLKVVEPGVVWVATIEDFISYDYIRRVVLARYPLTTLNDQYSLAKYAYFFDNHGELIALNDSTAIIQGGYFPLYNGQSRLHLAGLDVNNGAIKKLSVGLPHWVHSANHFGGLNLMHFGVMEDELYYNFPFSDSLFRYDVNENKSLPALQLDSPLLPTVLTTYQGDASMESIINHSSASDFYMGFHHLGGHSSLKYRFSIASNEGPPQSYRTQLELFKEDRLLAKEALCNWCKTRSFAINDTIFLFREGPAENQLCFELITLKE